MKVLSIIGYLMMLVAIIGLLINHSIFSFSVIVIFIQTAGIILMLWARITFGRRSFHATAGPTEGSLVTNGPYRLIRHPIYTAVILFCFPGVLANLNVLPILLLVLLLIGSMIRMLIEEHLLISRYPEYIDYIKRTKRVIPYII
jgi:protein-S-isoprenylcysteine O-methyltransferase Ste14